MIMLSHHIFDSMQSLKHKKLDICGQIEGILRHWMTEHQEIPSNSHF